MHSVLWGSLQRTRNRVLRNLNTVSMHSVLWGSLQHTSRLRSCSRRSFNALCALGFSSTGQEKGTGEREWVSMHSVLWGSLQLRAVHEHLDGITFQCTLCFGVLFNMLHRGQTHTYVCFNALCALGFSSTYNGALPRSTVGVSMHSVLWGSLQHGSLFRKRFLRVSMHSVLWGSLQRQW